MSKRETFPEEQKLVRDILDIEDDFDIRTGDVNKVRYLFGELDRMIHVTVMKSDLVKDHGYDWRKYQDTFKISTKEAVYLECSARLRKKE